MGLAKLFGLIVDRAKIDGPVALVAHMVDGPPPETREEWLERKRRELASPPAVRQ